MTQQLQALTVAKLDDMAPLGINKACVEFCPCLIQQILTFNIFLSKTTRPRALIFCIEHNIVDLYQACSNYAPGAKNGPASGSHILHWLI